MPDTPPIPPDLRVIDTGYLRPRFDAVYLLCHAGRAAFIDAGTHHALPRLLAALAEAGLAPEAVDYVILTHVHLDHAGGAGQLMAALPRARLVVHPRGAPHMIDPGRLVAGAAAVYGQARMRALYGDILPVEAARVQAAPDGTRLDLAGRALHLLDSPGHARHHLCVHDPAGAALFTGDAFGLCYRELDTPAGPFVVPTTSPVQFDPEAWTGTLDRLLALGARWACPTHYGPVTGLPALGRQLARRIRALAGLARACAGLAGEARHTRLLEGQWDYLEGEYRAAGGDLPTAEFRAVLGLDVEINAQGLAVWLDRQARGAG